jgi:hypothetical protein
MNGAKYVVVKGRRDWRFLWLRRVRRKVRVSPPMQDYQVFSDPFDKEMRTK